MMLGPIVRSCDSWGEPIAFKEVADYGTGPQAVVTVSEAQEAIASAGRFVDYIAGVLS